MPILGMASLKKGRIFFFNYTFYIHSNFGTQITVYLNMQSTIQNFGLFYVFAMQSLDFALLKTSY